MLMQNARPTVKILGRLVHLFVFANYLLFYYTSRNRSKKNNNFAKINTQN